MEIMKNNKINIKLSCAKQQTRTETQSSYAGLSFIPELATVGKLQPYVTTLKITYKKATSNKVQKQKNMS